MGVLFLKKREEEEEHVVSPLGLLRHLTTSCAAVAGFVCDMEDLNADQRPIFSQVGCWAAMNQRNFIVGTILVWVWVQKPLTGGKGVHLYTKREMPGKEVWAEARIIVGSRLNSPGIGGTSRKIKGWVKKKEVSRSLQAPQPSL
jgi:hypothetical protein